MTVRNVSARSHWCQLYLFIGIFLNIFQELMGMSPTVDNVVNSCFHRIWCEELLISLICPQRPTFLHCFTDWPTNIDLFF